MPLYPAVTKRGHQHGAGYHHPKGARRNRRQVLGLAPSADHFGGDILDCGRAYAYAGKCRAVLEGIAPTSPSSSGKEVKEVLWIPVSYRMPARQASRKNRPTSCGNSWPWSVTITKSTKWENNHAPSIPASRRVLHGRIRSVGYGRPKPTGASP